MIKSILYRSYLPVIFSVLLLYTAKINWSDGQWQDVMQADARGYYAYLPAIFIYHDANFGFYEEVEVQNAYNPDRIYDYRASHNGHSINKYFVGESVLIAPFFITAHVLSQFTDNPADGYSRLYIISVTVAALVYLFIGLLALKKTLQLFGLDQFNTMITLCILVFGTNLFYYSIGEAGISHVYSFSLISLFIYQATRYFQTYQLKHVLYGALFFGLILLIRPVNGIVLLSLPFLSLDKDTFKEGVQKFFGHWQRVVISLGIILAICSIQLIIYKIQTGSFFVYSYGDEGFNFDSPQIINFLFSYKKGFFLYTPICFVALLGFIPLWKNKFRFIAMFLFLFLVVYILSSWWMWYYGGSFSSRVMVEYLPFFAILLGVLFQSISKLHLKVICLSVCFLLVGVNQIQTLQYRYRIIHWSNMDKESYWDTFLDLDPVMYRREEVQESSSINS